MNITIKTCNKCHIEKSISDFYLSRPLVYRSECKSCYLKYKKTYNTEHHKDILSQASKWRNENREKLNLLHKKYRKQDPNINKRYRGYYYGNLDKNRKYQREWYYKNRQTNIEYCISKNVSQAIRHSLKTGKHNIHWEMFVDYTLTELRNHIEKQFKTGMSWENYGFRGWHIDHIIPISSFDITSYDCIEFKKCWSLNNLQPLWWYENLSKGNRIVVSPSVK
jgi:hypothetical protein